MSRALFRNTVAMVALCLSEIWIQPLKLGSQQLGPWFHVVPLLVSSFRPPLLLEQTHLVVFGSTYIARTIITGTALIIPGQGPFGYFMTSPDMPEASRLTHIVYDVFDLSSRRRFIRRHQIIDWSVERLLKELISRFVNSIKMFL
jgi:hypothetical protein